MMKILVIVTGSISAYKAASLVSFLSKEHTVKVMMTKNATKFITPLTFETLSKQKVLCNMFEDEEVEHVSHIYYGQEYDCIIVAPASANFIGKVANGIADDLPTSTIIAATKPIFIAPAMNTEMFKNLIVQRNLKFLEDFMHMYVIQPASGTLACGSDGIGKLPSTKEIVNFVFEKMKEKN